MKLPFTIEQFLGVFKLYNEQVFPIQILLYISGFVAIMLAGKNENTSSRFVALILALLWIWMGIVYHILFFSKINPAARLFGALFIIQGLIFLLMGFAKKNLRFAFKLNGRGIAGAILIFLSLVVYPLLNYMNGHHYPHMPTFGLPCPTTIFTLGLLCWSDKKLSVIIWIIPVLWSAIGFGAALSLGVKEDYFLLLAGILGTIIFLSSKRKMTAIN